MNICTLLNHHVLLLLFGTTRKKTRLLGSGSGSRESEVLRRKRSSTTESGHGKLTRLAPQLAHDYNIFMESIDTGDHLRNSKSVARRASKRYIQLF